MVIRATQMPASLTKDLPATALITGAGRRIGAVIAEHLASQGYDLVIHYHRSVVAAQELQQRLHKTYRRRITLKAADLADPASLEEFWAGLPPCTLLIHNASRFHRDTLAEMTAATLRHHLAVNFESPLLLTQGFMAQLPEDAAGNIIMLGDGMAGWSIAPPFFTYAASKLALSSSIDLLAAACAPRARANMIAPGLTLEGESDNDDTTQHLTERAPLHRRGTPQEVCTAIDFLLASPGMTGQIVSISNGFGLVSARTV